MTNDHVQKTQREKIKRAWKTVHEYLRTSDALRLLIVISVIVLTMLIFVAAIVPARYDLHIGQVPNVTIAATKDVVDEVTTEQKRVEAAAFITPTYKYQEGVTESVLSLFDQVFSQLRAVRQYGETLRDDESTHEYTREELDYAGGMLTMLSLRDYQMSTLLDTSHESLEALQKSLYTAVKNTMNGHVTQGQESEAIQNISMIVGFKTDTDLLQNVVQPVLKSIMQPNMVIDQDATNAAREEARKLVEPVVFKQGQNIVVKGEGRVAVNQLRMLESLGLLSTVSLDMTIYLGAILLVFLVMSILFVLLRVSKEETMFNTKRLILLSIIMIITLGFAVLSRFIDLHIAPTILCAMLISSLISLRAGIYCNVAMALLVSALAAGGSQSYTALIVNVFSTTVISGTVVSIIMSLKASRLRALIAGVVASVLNFLVMLSLGLITADSLSAIYMTVPYVMGAGVLSGLLSIGLQPLLEAIFNLPTPMKLLELSNPNHPLLKRMMLEAPGTYHHSILVANLAEASAEAIGANPLLARVGAYYHDIGKLKRPLYFKENQVGIENIHDQTDPQVSAAILTAHTQDGVALAKAYRLPQEIQRIIAEHHGNTPVMYFYHKAVTNANGKHVDISNFRYDGNLPSTKESAIIMLCDTIEAAIRSKNGTTNIDDMEEYILKLIRGKLADGQLNNAPLTLSDFDKITNACITVLKGVYHERIQYPDEVIPKEKHRPLLKKSKLENKAEIKKEMLNKVDAIPLYVQAETEVHTEEKEIKQQETQPMDNPLHVAPMPVQAPVSIDDLFKLEPIQTVDISQLEFERLDREKEKQKREQEALLKEQEKMQEVPLETQENVSSDEMQAEVKENVSDDIEIEKKEHIKEENAN